MAKARSRVAARKVKDRWKAKNWYNVLAPASFDNATIAETIADEPVKLIDRVTEISLQDLTNDFRKSHIKLFFRIYQIEESNAKTQYIGHTLTSDYLRRMIRRRRSKIDGVYDVKTRDGARVRVKPFATTDQRIQNSQKKIVRFTMRKTIYTKARAMTLSEFIKYVLEGKLGSDIFKSCKSFYPIRRVEIHKTQVLQQPTIEIEEPTPTDKIDSEVKSEEESEEKLESSAEERSDEKIIQDSEEELSDEGSEEIIKEEKPDEAEELETDKTKDKKNISPDSEESLEPDETSEEKKE
ncbi:MAG: 30S ribosomal protein S3ae [Candidatus Thermoplasmatota archaeon]|nr:30S ribosomal protein S3ae [Candidatus Thermoplasmatota archaeon]